MTRPNGGWTSPCPSAGCTNTKNVRAKFCDPCRTTCGCGNPKNAAAKRCRSCANRAMTSIGTCSDEECGKPIKTNGRCHSHNEKARRAALPFKECIEDDCKKDSAKYGVAGRCAMHSKRFRIHGDASVTVRVAGGRPLNPCAADKCSSLENINWAPYCSMHGSRVRRHGDPTVIKQPIRNFIESLPTDPGWDCIIYGGTLTARGYGPYRYVYAKAWGGIPEGLQIDHKCRVISCVNPNHLEAVTPRENYRRKWVAINHEKKYGPQTAEFWLAYWDREAR